MHGKLDGVIQQRCIAFCGKSELPEERKQTHVSAEFTHSDVSLTSIIIVTVVFSLCGAAR